MNSRSEINSSPEIGSCWFTVRNRLMVKNRRMVRNRPVVRNEQCQKWTWGKKWTHGLAILLRSDMDSRSENNPMSGVESKSVMTTNRIMVGNGHKVGSFLE